MTTPPISIAGVIASPRNNQPNAAANAGIRNVTAAALVGPVRAINRKYRM